MSARRVDPLPPRVESPGLTLQVVHAADLTPREQAEILALCSAAFEMDYEPFYRTFDGAVHVLGSIGDTLISHALWVTRWLEVGESERYPDGLGLLRTAYVEAVATQAEHRGRGFARRVMERLAGEIAGYDLGALSPGAPELYASLGWEYWQGPRFVREGGEQRPTPDEEVMILRLPGTPPLDLDAALSCEWREGEVW